MSNDKSDVEKYIATSYGKITRDNMRLAVC